MPNQIAERLGDADKKHAVFLAAIKTEPMTFPVHPGWAVASESGNGSTHVTIAVRRTRQTVLWRRN